MQSSDFYRSADNYLQGEMRKEIYRTEQPFGELPKAAPFAITPNMCVDEIAEVLCDVEKMLSVLGAKLETVMVPPRSDTGVLRDDAQAAMTVRSPLVDKLMDLKVQSSHIRSVIDNIGSRIAL